MRLIGLAVVFAICFLAPLAAEGQQAGKIYRIGYLTPFAADGLFVQAFRQGLRDRHGGTRVMTTLKRLALLVVVLTVPLIPRPASLLETEVRHGESPKWSGPIVGRYAVTVVGYYTDRPDLARAGVRRVEWYSDAQAKRRAEMLALRAAFLDWFVEEWVREGGVREDGVHQILGYPLR